MICGTIILEDTVLTFRQYWEEATQSYKFRYTVCDTIEGKEETVETSLEAFNAALYVALDTDGKALTDKQAVLAEEAMPKNEALRWIP